MPRYRRPVTLAARYEPRDRDIGRTGRGLIHSSFCACQLPNRESSNYMVKTGRGPESVACFILLCLPAATWAGPVGGLDQLLHVDNVGMLPDPPLYPHLRQAAQAASQAASRACSTHTLALRAHSGPSRDPPMCLVEPCKGVLPSLDLDETGIGCLRQSGLARNHSTQCHPLPTPKSSRNSYRACKVTETVTWTVTETAKLQRPLHGPLQRLQNLSYRPHRYSKPGQVQTLNKR